MAEKKDLLSFFKPAPTSGDLIKAFRKNFGISQDEMAMACQINQANLSAIENGTRQVGPTVALKLAAFLGVSPELILFPQGYEVEAEYVNVLERISRLKQGTSAPVQRKSAGKSTDPIQELRTFMGSEPLPRTELIKKVWAYIKKKKLDGEFERVKSGNNELIKKTHRLVKSRSKAYARSTKKAR